MLRAGVREIGDVLPLACISLDHTLSSDAVNR